MRQILSSITQPSISNYLTTDKFERSPTNPRLAYFIATALAKLGEDKQAEEWATKAMEIAPDDFLTLYNVACFYSVNGKPDLAFEILFNLSSRSNAEMRAWILTDSDLQPLHQDRRWEIVRQRSTTPA